MPSTKKRKARERAARRRRIRIIGGVAAGVLVVAVLAFAIGSSAGNTDTSGLQETRSVVLTGDALLPLPASGTDPAIGMAIPEVRGSSFDGTPTGIVDDGSPKAIWVIAHWCPHCQAEVPRIVSLSQQGRVPAGIEVYAISTSVDPSAPNYPPSAWLGGVSWPYPVIADDTNGTAGRALGLTSFPYLVLVGADGRVVSRTAGELGDDGIVAALQQLAA